MQDDEKPEEKRGTEQKKVAAMPTEEVEGPSALDEKFGPAEVKVKEGVAVDMLTGSEEEDSTSDDSGDDSDKDDGTLITQTFGITLVQDFRNCSVIQ